MRAVLHLALIAAAAAGCDAGGGGVPAPVDGGSTPDTGAPPSALRVTWSASPAIPGPFGNDIEITTAAFNLFRLQVVGDASGGEPTTRRQVRIAWGDTAMPAPAPTVFPQAPTGLYSKIALELDSQSMAGMAYEITGTARVSGQLEPFAITDDQELDLEIAGYEVTYQPGQDAVLPVALDLTPALARINFVQLPVVGGVRVLGPDDPQISDVRAGLALAFVPER